MKVPGENVKRKQRVQTREVPRACDLLAWYDHHRRNLPWRAGPGETPNPYRVWVSEIMLQQTTARAVAPYFERFLARWPDINSLAKAPLDDVLRLWAGLGYYTRARNLHACAVVVVQHHGGRFPQDEAPLAALPGIGRYTAAAIAAIAFGARTVPVDGNVERVVARLFAVEEELPGAKPKIWTFAQGLAPARRTGDFAQALMDLGATICTPRRPACALCPWRHGCAAHEGGEPERFPIKARRRTGRERRGAAFVILRGDGFVLVRSRQPGGLLGGMTEVPTSAWTHDFDDCGALAGAPRLSGTRLTWRRIPGRVTHAFTHFPLELAVFRAKAPPGAIAPAGARWVALTDITGEALPSLMHKVLAHARIPGSPA
jgi:A/G-specific adenine glycosylase